MEVKSVFQILSFNGVEFKALLWLMLCVQRLQCDQATKSKKSANHFVFQKNSFCDKSNMTNPYEVVPNMYTDFVAQ